MHFLSVTCLLILLLQQVVCLRKVYDMKAHVRRERSPQWGHSERRDSHSHEHSHEYGHYPVFYQVPWNYFQMVMPPALPYATAYPQYYPYSGYPYTTPMPYPYTTGYWTNTQRYTGPTQYITSTTSYPSTTTRPIFTLTATARPPSSLPFTIPSDMIRFGNK